MPRFKSTCATHFLGPKLRRAKLMPGLPQKVDAAFARGPTFDSLENRYSVQFGSIYLRAITGLGSTDADLLRQRLKEGQDYLKTLTTGPFGRFGFKFSILF